MSEAYETLLIEPHDRVVLVRLNRPKALNALNSQVMTELVAAFERFDRDPEIGCIVLTGSEKAFAAGADIKEMQSKSATEMQAQDFFAGWEAISRIRKPIVAAVSGFALGGGCELAMMCDVVYASETAKFGQPEIRLGVIPGMGGSQRLARIVGRPKAMDMCLTGRLMEAEEAERAGLVSRIFPAADLEARTLEAATVIAGMSLPSVISCKESVNRADEGSLHEGLRFERRLFHALFSTDDRTEGMAAFIEKRPPRFTHR